MAVRRLETPSLAGRLAALAGKPVGFVQRALPAAASTAIAKVAKQALEAGYSFRFPTIDMALQEIFR